MKGLVLAEKPSLMRSIQSAYQHDSFSFQLDFAAFHGHLMELAEPKEYNPAWEHWTLEALPMIPDQFRYLPKDKKSIQTILAQIQNGHYDFVVNACDAGREGELIFWSFYEANHLTLPVRRLWSSTTVEKDLQQALHNLRPSSDFDNLRASSKFRAEFDWLTGMNFSRAISLRTNQKSNIGRVVTPTLKMVVDRENEIRNFVSQPFWEIEVKMQKGAAVFTGLVVQPPEHKQTRFMEQAAAGQALASLTQEAVVESVEKKRKSTPAPTLYSTLALQKDASKYFKFRASKTDAIAQELYESGYISYPRTECRYIPNSVVAEIPAILKTLENLPALAGPLQQVTPDAIQKATTGKRYVDDAKLTDHHAIIPTSAGKDPNKLNPDQWKIYELVAKRFLSIFLPPYVVDTTTVLLSSNGIWIKAAGRTVVEKGFSVLYQDRSKDVILPPLQKGDTVAICGTRLKEGKTEPPPRYTEETLLDAMANAGRFVSAAEQRAILKETAGLGTGATRAGILQKLETTGMCRVEKKTYIPTDFGMQLIAAIGNRDICSPALTAEWEALLRDLEEHGHPEVFQTKMLDYIRSETADLVGTISADLGGLTRVQIGKCPLCGQPVLMGKNYYRCQSYKQAEHPCTFIIGKKFLNANVTQTDMKALLAGKETRSKKMRSKNGHDFTASMKLNEQGRLSLAGFPQGNAEPSAPICACPICHQGEIRREGRRFKCTRNECTFFLAAQMCGAELTDADVKDLCEGRPTRAISFTWKSGKQGNAKLQFLPEPGKDGRLPLNFLFEN